VESQIRAANGVVFAVYTNFGSTATMSTAYANISPYFDGSYFTGTMPPISIPYTPFVGVVDLENMEVIGRDNTETDYLMPSEVVSLCQQANSK
jgi:hypothetical protein